MKEAPVSHGTLSPSKKKQKRHVQFMTDDPFKIFESVKVDLDTERREVEECYKAQAEWDIRTYHTNTRQLALFDYHSETLEGRWDFTLGIRAFHPPKHAIQVRRHGRQAGYGFWEF